MSSISASLFINNGKTDLEILFHSNNFSDLEKNVEKLFNEDQLDHAYSKAFDMEAKFSVYWKMNGKYWSSLDLNKDGKNELFFLPKAINPDDIELIEIYTQKKGIYNLIYKESGHIIAYKIHPNTKEIVLFHHQYPCCSSASHNINMVRLVNGKINLRKKYFLARDEGMKGDFFPNSVNFTSKFNYLKKRTTVRWSPEKISKNAWSVFQENKLAIYPKLTPFRILAKKGNWYYIEICGEPIIRKKKLYDCVINSENFNNVHVFGWIFN